MAVKTPKIISTRGASEIAFALGRSSLGEILVARGDKGICAILLGDDPKSLIRDLGALFARDRLVGAEASPDPALSAALAAAKQAVEEPWRKFDLPLDIKGTEFQREVWRELREIPSRNDYELYRDRPAHRGAQGFARGGGRLRRQRPGHRHSLSSGGAQQWLPVRISLGSGAQAPFDRARTKPSRLTGPEAACGNLSKAKFEPDQQRQRP